MNQIDLHKKIDELVKKSPLLEMKEEVSVFMENEDAKSYFYSTADEKWLPWLWKNSFLESIKEKAQDLDRYSYRTPELNYLARMAEKDPKTVTDILLDTPISSSNFNPEVVDRFFWIASELPAEELTRVIPKMRDEKWIFLMNNFNSHVGFKFESMFKTLSKAGDDKHALILSDILFEVRKKDAPEEDKDLWTENPFYFKDLEYSGVFDFLEEVNEKYLSESLSLVSSTMGKVILFNADKREPRSAFSVGDGLAFYEIDFFSLETGQKKHTSYRDDVRDLVATMKTLAIRAFKESCPDKEKTQAIFDAYIATLPDSQAMWRFRLFVYSLCPDIFSKDIKKALLRLSEVENPHDITMGAEYQQLLRRSLDLFSDPEKQKFKEVILGTFSDLGNEKLSKGDVFGIFSIIQNWLTEEEKEKAEKYIGQTLKSDFQPEPMIGKMRGGYVQEKSVVSSEELAAMSVVDISKKLQKDWIPKNLTREEYTESSIIEYSAEGLGKAIQDDMTKRFQDYIQNAPLFFERELLDAHYTYIFVRGVYEVIKNTKGSLDIEWEGLFGLISSVITSFEKIPVEDGKRKRDGGHVWLAGWDAVHNAMAEVMEVLLKQREDKTDVIEFKKYRDKILVIIRYLLAHPNPDLESEVCTPRSNQSSTGKGQYDCSDPFTHAINSVRGKAFEALISFVYKDGEQFPKEAPVKVSSDVVAIYEELLGRENTRAIMFLFGHYLPSIYFRDKKWTRTLFDKLFGFDTPKRDLALAAWEGYLTNNLYNEIFQELEPYYSRAIELKREDYTPREYFKDLDEVLATHVALAFMHFPQFTYESALFKKFWQEKNLKRQTEFISFIGRYSISRDQAKEWLKKSKIDSKKLESFWDWILEAPVDPKVFESFGFWMDAEWNVFDPAWQAERTRKTLEKTGGAIEWNHNLQESLPIFAKVSPQDTLTILKLHLEYVAKKAPQQGWFHLDDKVQEVFQFLYENPETKKGTYNLIDILLPLSNGMFWKLKDIVKE
ncbi:MAG: hypothetical protein IPJ68_04050 [Candidatus Moraniibacteriota bacterium]|nr:MAG: hypothetical protein IPJ68_04050 [Candidatus Moranbacteria bacterium]